MTEENSAASTGTGRKERRKEWWQKYKKEMKGQKADQEDESIEGKDKKLKSPSVKRKRQSEDKSTQRAEKKKKTAVSEQSESDEESSDTGKDSQKDTQKPKKKDKKYVLFLGNLTYTTKEEDIRKHFADLVGVKVTMKVIICGGGIVGCSLAYHLTLRGVKPTVVERCSVACAASGKAAGFLVRNWLDGTPVAAIARAGYQLLEELGKTFPECDFRPMDTHAIQYEEGAGKKAEGVPDWVDQPVVNHSVIGDKINTAQVHSKKLTEALMKAAAENGAELLIGEVEEIQLNGSKNKVQGVKVNGKVMEADIAVVAMGVWSDKITASLGLPIKVIEETDTSAWTGKSAEWLPYMKGGQRGHSLVLKPSHPLSADALYTHVKTKDGEKRPEVYPRPDGDVFVCGVYDNALIPDDPSQIQPDAETCQALQRSAILLSSKLAEASLVKNQACFLPKSPDGLPLLGKIPGIEGGFVATGHGFTGIITGPISGAALAELITDGKCSVLDLSPFDPMRIK